MDICRLATLAQSVAEHNTQNGGVSDVTKLSVAFGTAVFGALLAYSLNRKSKKRDDGCQQITADINNLIQIVEKASIAIAAHQAGKLKEYKTLKKSREACAAMRKQASQNKARLCLLLISKADATQWELEHLRWINATDKETGLITEREFTWSGVEVTELERASGAYTAWLTNLRQRVISGVVRVGS